jgi:hypothetical protein
VSKNRFEIGERVRIKDSDFWHLGAGSVCWIWLYPGTNLYEVAFDSGEYAEVRIQEYLLESVIPVEELSMVQAPPRPWLRLRVSS